MTVKEFVSVLNENAHVRVYENDKCLCRSSMSLKKSDSNLRKCWNREVVLITTDEDYYTKFFKVLVKTS